MIAFGPSMMGSFGRLSSVTMLLLLASCQKASGRQLRDTEGRTFAAHCAVGGECKLEQKSGPQRIEKPNQALLVGSRLVGVCDVKEGEPPQGPMDCRPLVCETDADCPPTHGTENGHCLNKRCSDPAGPIGVQDSIMLCLSGTGLGHDSQQQIERYALAMNCGKPCKVPQPCPQL